MRVIFVFVDGLGIGNRDVDINPIYASKHSELSTLMENARFIADASLGVEGLPQSATGQTAIFTGKNAAKVLNRHMSGQPTQTLTDIINKINMFSELKKMGLSVTNANVYRSEYLEKILDKDDKKNRPSVTSVMCMASETKFKTVDEFRNNTGVYHDITGERLKDSGYDVNIISAERAAENLYNISRKYDFTLYEHFVTDIAGHKADLSGASEVIDRLNLFISALIERMNFEEDVMIVTSDHGNIEDMSVKTHTMNKVPVIILGEKANNVSINIESLLDIMPFVIELFKKEMDRT